MEQRPSEPYQDEHRLYPKARSGMLVLGMHRSGTSALARVLAIMGCSLPATLLGENASNPLGHWESDVIRSVNDRLLGFTGTTWQHWAPIEDSYFKSSTSGGLLATAARAIETEFGESPLFVLKDPRLSLLMPFWFEVLAGLEIGPAIVCAVRYPGEVARSLAHRDQIEESVGQLVWLRHMLEAEASTRGRERVYVCYDQLLEDWPEVVGRIGSAFGISWPQTIENCRDEVESFLSSSHRHHTFEKHEIDKDRPASSWTREVFTILSSWSRLGENAGDYARLDDIRDAFNAAAPAFGPAVSVAQTALLYQPATSLIEDRLRTDIADAEAKFLDMKAYAEKLQASLANAEQSGEDARLAEIEAERLKDLSKIKELLGRLAELESRMRQRDEELAQTWNALEQAQERAAERDEIQTRLAHVTEKLADANDWVFKLAGDRQAAEKARAAAERKFEASSLARDAALGKLAVTTAELSGELASVKAVLSDTYANANTEHQRRIDAESELVSSLRDLHDQQQRNAELAGQLSVSQSALAQRQEELSQILSQLKEFEQRCLRVQGDYNHEREKRMQAEQSTNRAEEEIQYLKTHIEEELKKAEHKLAKRSNEISTLSKIFVEQSNHADSLQSVTKWLREVRSLEEVFPKWWSIMPSNWRQRRAQQRYKFKGLFDADIYLALYPDVEQQGMDPIRHYILHGIAEGRVCPRPL